MERDEWYNYIHMKIDDAFATRTNNKKMEAVMLGAVAKLIEQRRQWLLTGIQPYLQKLMEKEI